MADTEKDGKDFARPMGVTGPTEAEIQDYSFLRDIAALKASYGTLAGTVRMLDVRRERAEKDITDLVEIVKAQQAQLQALRELTVLQERAIGDMNIWLSNLSNRVPV